MRRRVRRFASIGVVVTIVDFVIAVGGRRYLGVPVIVSDAVAIVVAATISWFANRRFTFRGDPRVRWVSDAGAYIRTAIFTGAIDVVAMRVMVSVLGSASVRDLVAAKAVAVSVAGVIRALAYRAVLFQVVRSVQRRMAGRASPPPGTVRLSVVVPAYGEEERIGATIAQLRDALRPVGDVELVVVDDGSPDATAAAARGGGADVVIEQPENRGKGAAVRAGVLAASGRTIAFTDADLSYPPEQILRLLEEVEHGWDVVVGSRRHVDTTTLVRARRLRELSGRLFNVVTFVALLGQYRDTQCGLKAFRSDVARLLFCHGHIDGFAFDVELFHLVERYKLTLREVPVSLVSSETSTVRLGSHALQMIADVVRIRRLSLTDAYDLSDAEAALLAS